jgi:hypothetical protein
MTIADCVAQRILSVMVLSARRLVCLTLRRAGYFRRFQNCNNAFVTSTRLDLL